jgi:hypothetical protein
MLISTARAVSTLIGISVQVSISTSLSVFSEGVLPANSSSSSLSPEGIDAEKSTSVPGCIANPTSPNLGDEDDDGPVCFESCLEVRSEEDAEPRSRPRRLVGSLHGLPKDQWRGADAGGSSGLGVKVESCVESGSIGVLVEIWRRRLLKRKEGLKRTPGMARFLVLVLGGNVSARWGLEGEIAEAMMVTLGGKPG